MRESIDTKGFFGELVILLGLFLASKMLVTLFGTVSGIDTRPNRIGDEAVEAYACFVGGSLDDGLLAFWNSDTNIVLTLTHA